MNDAADIFTLPRDKRVLVTAGASGIGRECEDQEILFSSDVGHGGSWWQIICTAILNFMIWSE
jgi:hypothetical protein